MEVLEARLGEKRLQSMLIDSVGCASTEARERGTSGSAGRRPSDCRGLDRLLELSFLFRGRGNRSAQATVRVVMTRRARGARADDTALGLLLAHIGVKSMMQKHAGERKAVVTQTLEGRRGRVVFGGKTGEDFVNVLNGQSNATAMGVDDIVKIRVRATRKWRRAEDTFRRVRGGSRRVEGRALLEDRIGLEGQPPRIRTSHRCPTRIGRHGC